jgi:hypothetical protein
MTVSLLKSETAASRRGAELRAAAIRREQKQSQQRYEALVNSIDGIVWKPIPDAGYLH